MCIAVFLSSWICSVLSQGSVVWSPEQQKLSTRCYSSLRSYGSCMGPDKVSALHRAPGGRVSIGDILAGPSVALPPLHPVTHVRPAALSHAASASGTQPRAPAFRTPDPSWLITKGDAPGLSPEPSAFLSVGWN
uniref:Uncharacterized protein n=1 Tax=Mustela putorius furo TaxID=9669 RepID=M3Z0S0_MUSPF